MGQESDAFLPLGVADSALALRIIRCYEPDARLGDARRQLAHFGNKIRTYLECHTVCEPVYNDRMDRFLTTFKPGTVMTAPGSCNCAEQKVSRKIQWCAVGGEPVCSPVGVVSGFLDCHVGCAPRNDSVRMK